jgi:hypothetical protein
MENMVVVTEERMEIAVGHAQRKMQENFQCTIHNSQQFEGRVNVTGCRSCTKKSGTEIVLFVDQ